MPERSDDKPILSHLPEALRERLLSLNRENFPDGSLQLYKRAKASGIPITLQDIDDAEQAIIVRESMQEEERIRKKLSSG